MFRFTSIIRQIFLGYYVVEDRLLQDTMDGTLNISLNFVLPQTSGVFIYAAQSWTMAVNPFSSASVTSTNDRIVMIENCKSLCALGETPKNHSFRYVYVTG